SLLLSFGTAYPEYLRCLTVVLNNLPAGQPCQVRIESSLFAQPFVSNQTPAQAALTLNPDLPWNYDVLRKVGVPRPEIFVVSVAVNDRLAAQASLTCMVHPVNEAVSRVFDAATGTWQDTSVCFAAYVNEDNPWISGFLQDVVNQGLVARFAGYD